MANGSLASLVPLHFNLAPLQPCTSGAHVSFETVCLVTQGMSRLYDLLVSNQVLYNYGAVLDYRTLPVTLILHRTAEGAPLVLPLGGKP